MVDGDGGVPELAEAVDRGERTASFCASFSNDVQENLDMIERGFSRPQIATGRDQAVLAFGAPLDIVPLVYAAIVAAVDLALPCLTPEEVRQVCLRENWSRIYMPPR